MDNSHARGVTLVELVIVMGIMVILALTVPIIIFRGVGTMVLLPRAIAVNDAATEAIHQVVEGGWSTLPGQTAPVRGLRFAVRRSSTEAALWLAEAGRIGFRTSDGQFIVLRLDVAESIKRSLPASATCPPASGTEEVLPYQSEGIVRILPSGSLFRYYNQSGDEIVSPGGCSPDMTIRRVDIRFVAQTGSGVFMEGQAQQDVLTSAAVRVP